MTAQKIANKIGKVHYGWEPPHALCQEAKKKRCVIVFGYSDDLCELRGLVNDEVGCYEGGEIKTKELAALGIELDARWCESYYGWTWSYFVNKPFSTFHIMDDGEKYCEGIVFCVD